MASRVVFARCLLLFTLALFANAARVGLKAKVKAEESLQESRSLRHLLIESQGLLEEESYENLPGLSIFGAKNNTNTTASDDGNSSSNATSGGPVQNGTMLPTGVNSTGNATLDEESEMKALLNANESAPMDIAAQKRFAKLLAKKQADQEAEEAARKKKEEDEKRRKEELDIIYQKMKGQMSSDLKEETQAQFATMQKVLLTAQQQTTANTMVAVQGLNSTLNKTMNEFKDEVRGTLKSYNTTIQEEQLKLQKMQMESEVIQKTLYDLGSRTASLLNQSAEAKPNTALGEIDYALVCSSVSSCKSCVAKSPNCKWCNMGMGCTAVKSSSDPCPKVFAVDIGQCPCHTFDSCSDCRSLQTCNWCPSSSRSTSCNTIALCGNDNTAALLGCPPVNFTSPVAATPSPMTPQSTPSPTSSPPDPQVSTDTTADGDATTPRFSANSPETATTAYSEEEKSELSDDAAFQKWLSQQNN